jgi:trehalose 6-phosphate phosphatase
MTAFNRYIAAQHLALFLDVDGTLLDLAATPEAVQVPPTLRNTLELAARHVQGALALVSGRTVASLDRLFAPSLFPVAGQHGFERRNYHGQRWQGAADARVLDTARARLQALQARHHGLQLEDKGGNLALHYRGAPELHDELHAELSALQQQLAPHLQLITGKYALELLPAGHSKRTAIEAFMREAPFAGRIPVFIGDDVADEAGFAAVNELGGYSIRVGDAAHTAARYRFSNVVAVIGWLHGHSLSLVELQEIGAPG